ncbi:hypothetical protein K7957_03720 [Sphingomonas yunnanensis]|uniref:hypothetical protein n=1 Tax=Sphingomonas yunnanensis TaxID=310400 RepID=UPI001CA669C3|nr:hypothetical protein [Sphingomonas yunnanensis]MBY9062037.1 hypothetical protein [Sphingomonas yunnanensis]
MRRLAGLGAVGTALLALSYVALTRAPASPPPSDGVRVVGAAGPVGTARLVAPPASAPTLPTRPAAATDETGASPRDRAALADLLAGQARDPAWAPGAEAELRSRLGPGGSATCAAFLCRVETLAPDRTGARTPDEQAMAITRDWPARLSYNPATASVRADTASPRLIFYVTRASDEKGSPLPG